MIKNILIGLLMLACYILFNQVLTWHNLYENIKGYAPVEGSLNALKLSTDVNEWRYENNHPPYSKGGKKLCTLATVRLQEIQSDFSHDKFVSEKDNLFGNGYGYFGENLLRGFITDTAALQGWLHSPEHLKNLLDSHYYYMCIACKGVYCAQELSSEVD